MKQTFLLLSLSLLPWALFAQTPLEGQTENADSTAKWWNKLSVEIHTGFSYMNDLWPYTGRDIEAFALPPAWDGHSYGIVLHYDVTDTWRAGIGVDTRRRGYFIATYIKAALGGYELIPAGFRNIEEIIHNWKGVVDIPITAEYHKGWFYARAGAVVECSFPLRPNSLNPEASPRYHRTVMKWWHGGVTASVGGLIPLSKHSTIRLGIEACAAFTPYGVYAEDWIDVMPSDRRYRTYTGWYCGVTAGYHFHF